jgi:phage tail sheath protein FI
MCIGHRGLLLMSEVAAYFDATSGGWRRWGDNKWITYDTDIEWLTHRRGVIASELAEFDAVIAAKGRVVPDGFEGLRVVE